MQHSIFCSNACSFQKLPVVHFKQLDSDCQTITSLQPIMFPQNKPSAATSQAQSIQCDSVYEIGVTD